MSTLITLTRRKTASTASRLYWLWLRLVSGEAAVLKVGQPHVGISVIIKVGAILKPLEVSSEQNLPRLIQ